MNNSTPFKIGTGGCGSAIPSDKSGGLPLLLLLVAVLLTIWPRVVLGGKLESDAVTLPVTTGMAHFSSVDFRQTYDVPPVVFAIATSDGGDPCHLRIRNVTVSGFEISQVEPPFEDGPHAGMTVHYLAIEPGRHVLADGHHIEVGTFDTATYQLKDDPASGWQTFNFDRTYASPPMVLAQIQTNRSEAGSPPPPQGTSIPWLTTVLANVTTTSADLALERSEVAAGSITTAEQVGYLVMESDIQGSFTDGAGNTVSYETLATGNVFGGWSNGCDTVGFDNTYATDPLVMATKRTRNGPDGGWFRRCSLSPSGVGLTVDEDMYADSDRNHIDESASILVFSTSFDTQVPTRAFITDFTVFAEHGRTVVRWETAAEEGTLGFFLERLDGTGAKYKRLNEKLLPGAMGSSLGGIYRFEDGSARPGETRTYRLVEEEIHGGRRIYGPFTLTMEQSVVGPQEEESGDFEALVIAGARYQRRAKTVPQGRKAPEKGLMSYGARPITLPAAIAQSDAEDGVPMGLKMAVATNGIYRILAGDVARGLGISEKKARTWIKKGRLAITNQGRSIAWYPGDKGLFVEFYAEAIDSPYTDENVYLLKKGRRTGVRPKGGRKPAPVEMQSGFITRLHLEQDRSPTTGFFDNLNVDFWMWEYLMPHVPGYRERSFDLTLPHMVPGTAGQVTVNLQGASHAEHRVEVRVNGAYLGEVAFNGIAPHSRVFAADQGVFFTGANTITLTTVEPLDGTSAVYLNSFDFSYEKAYIPSDDRLFFTGDTNDTVSIEGFAQMPRVYDVSDPARVPRIQAVTVDRAPGGEYRISLKPKKPETRYLAVGEGMLAEFTSDSLAILLESDLMNTAQTSDYLVIAPAELLAPARRLADYRRSRGLEASVILLEEIVDVFNHGLPHPEAVKDFLSYAWHNWTKAPRFVVRVGEGTYDYKDIKGYGENLMPPLLVPTLYGLKASENRLADVDGSDDGVPEMAVGILPADSVASLDVMIDKIIAYEASADGDWARRVLMVADNPDQGGNFHASSDRVAAWMPDGYDAESIYLGDLELEPAKDALVAGMNGGALLVNYMGHAGLDRLAGEGLLTRADLPLLNNRHRLPVLLAMTCQTGRFEIPGADTIGEDLISRPDGGVVALWAPTGWSLDGEARKLGEAFFKAVFRDGEKILGNAVLSALKAYAGQGGNRVMLDIYTLIGDPALELK